MLKLVVLSCMMSLVLGGTCPDYWMTYRGHCYRLYRSTVPWSTAKTRCEQNSAYLVSINSRSENDFVGFLSARLSDEHGPRTWLGLGPNYHYQNPKRWLDGNTMNYHNWRAGEPNNHDGRNEGCLEMNHSQKNKWNDTVCGERKQYICEKNAN